MARAEKPVRSPDSERADESDGRPRPASNLPGRPSQDGFAAPVPAFLSDPDAEPADDPGPQEIMPVLRRGFFTSVSTKILAAVAVAASAATLFAWLTSDATREVMKRARASIASATSPEKASAGPKEEKPVASEASSKAAPRTGATAQAAHGGTAVAIATPSREEIFNAYRRAAGVAPPPAPGAATPQPAPAPARQISAEELSALVGRARDLLAGGDIVSARLLLERAAEARDAGAALILAQTYDPQVLGTPDVRNITPEPSTARAWYEKAAQLGSAEAQRRLAQLPN